MAAADARGTCCGSSPRSRARAITHAWGGPIDVSPSHIPQVGTPARRARCTSRSATPATASGPTHLAGRALASLALDRRDELTRLPIVDSDAGAWVPPEPLAWLGGSLVRSAVVRARARRPSAASAPDLAHARRLRALPKALGMHLAR